MKKDCVSQSFLCIAKDGNVLCVLMCIEYIVNTFVFLFSIHIVLGYDCSIKDYGCIMSILWRIRKDFYFLLFVYVYGFNIRTCLVGHLGIWLRPFFATKIS